MKVSELIDSLQQCNPNANVLIYVENLDAPLSPEYDDIGLVDNKDNYFAPGFDSEKDVVIGISKSFYEK